MSLGTCAWCARDARTVTNIAKGRKLQMVPVCDEHLGMIEGQKAAIAAERAKKTQATRAGAPAAVPHWRQ